MNKEKKDYSIWKIHYCGEFKDHGLDCIPIFQTLAPTAALTEDDIVINQWTILREMD